MREHTFENLILLCAVCHARVTSGEIDRKAVLAYKANLGLMSSRYGDLERRVLERFVKAPELSDVVIDSSHVMLLAYLITDGLLEYLGPAVGALLVGDEVPSGDGLGLSHFGPARWGLTAAGNELVKRLRDALEVA